MTLDTKLIQSKIADYIFCSPMPGLFIGNQKERHGEESISDKNNESICIEHQSQFFKKHCHELNQQIHYIRICTSEY